MQRLMQNGALQTEGTPSMGAPGAIGRVPPLLMAIKACRSEEQSKHRRSNGRTYAEGRLWDFVFNERPPEANLLQNGMLKAAELGVGHGFRQQKGAGGESCLLPRPRA